MSSPPDQRTALTLAMGNEGDTGARIRAEFQRINEAFKSDGKTGQGHYPFRQASLARQVHYLALAIGESERRGRAERLEPRWTKLIGRYDQFRKEVGALTFLPNVISDDDLNGLCRYSTRRRGSGKPHFYSAMALFVIDQFETGQLDDDFIKFVMPQCEVNFPTEVRDHIVCSIAGDGESKPVDDATHAPTTEKVHEFPIINVGYTFHRSLFDRFTRFFEHFASGPDGGAHFVCYRPAHTSPNELVKSFLSIVPPSRRNRDSYGFVHVYKMPSMGDQNRISLGEVLPLEGGLYFVGGQRQMAEKKEKTLPFNTLKVVAVPWQPIEVREKIFGGLVMSSSYQGRHLVSRLALRATPTAHSKDIQLGGVDLRQLSENLLGDVRQETQLFADGDAHRETFSVRADMGAKRIADLCNNNPTSWDAPHSYFALNDEGLIDRRRALTKAIVDIKLAEAFGSEENPIFQNAEPGVEVFSFWRSLHFGPVTTK